MWYAVICSLTRLSAGPRARGRIALALLVCLSLAIPLPPPEHAGAVASAHALRQPARTAVAAALAHAAHATLPAGYPALDGAPRIPPVLLKAIAWVESGWRQFRAPDQPLVSPGGAYGVMQISSTTGISMGAAGATSGDAARASAQAVQIVRSAIANNYIYNIAYGARILTQKWAATPRIGVADPAVLEDWYYAVWAYNAWGWRNNPNNPAFTRAGTPATHPQTFPYQERVFYYVAHPPRDETGHPLWDAVPVALPSPRAIGRVPATLPAPSVPHADPSPALSDGPLVAPATDATGAGTKADAATVMAGSPLADGNVAAPGTTLHEAWLVRNTGAAFWSDYSWRFASGDLMGAPLTVSVPYAPPLADVPLAVDFVAPSRPGAYTGYWQLHDPTGQPVGQAVSVTVVVATPAASASPVTLADTAATPSAAVTPDAGAPPCLNAVASPSVSVAEGDLLDDADFSRDLSIPDCTVIAPGAAFVKTWEIRNTGTTTWDSRYHWHFEAGAALGPTRAVAAPSIVAPGATARFSVRMIAPSRPRAYLGYWQMTGPAGDVFGAQAWVSIRVGAPPPPTTTPLPGTTPIATSTPTPTIQPIPNGGEAHPPTATARSTPVPWFGPTAGRAFFAEGYTGSGYQEYLSLLNPRGRTLRARVTIYRADGATRVLAPLRLTPYTRLTLNLNLLAPRASTSLKIEGDGPLVAERSFYNGGNGHVVAGAPLPSRRWYVAEGYAGARFDDGLRVFNPYDVSTPLTITAYQSDGTARVSHRVVAAASRLRVSFDDIAPAGGSALTVDSGLPVVVESVVRVASASGPTTAMALTAPSRLWYFPDGGAKNGDKEFITVFNPDPRARATVRLRFVTVDGYQTPLTIHPGPHARAVFVIGGLIHQNGVAAVVESDRPVAAQETRYMRRGGAALVDGATRPARAWALADGYVGQGFKEWITLLNPNNHPVTATVRLIGRTGVARMVKVHQRAHWRDYLFLNPLLPRGPVAALVDADGPIVAGRTLLFNRDKGLSTTVGVALPGR